MSTFIHKHSGYDIAVSSKWKYNILFQKAEKLIVDTSAVTVGDFTFQVGEHYNQIGYPATGYSFFYRN